ncbi:hypothetical protein KTC92_06140 [Clostridium sp. CM027]|uniref:hypothetical protein n=1 Tax=Clostridium sp. CM027 TaxID=2849865 RepID=UPI00215A222F|nr:hypothetical protein [Clostridium sp. CM027]UVE42033.1 hypothetical protein KTC92_06140 [Clostridium sp. CM027]
MAVIFIFVLEGLGYLLLPVLFLNVIFIKKFDDKKLSIYTNIQKNVIEVSFLYLIGIGMISLSNKSIYIGLRHIVISLIIVLILPMIIFSLLKIKSINIFFLNLKLKLIKVFNATYCVLIVLIILFHFFYKENYLNKYSFNAMFYLIFIYFLINYTKEKKEEF